MTRAILNDGSGHWIEDGELMSTVHTSEGWLKLPDSYEVVSQADEETVADQLEDGLNLTLQVEDRLVRVQSIDFDFIEGE